MVIDVHYTLYHSKFLPVSALTLALWEHLLTFDREVSLIWFRPWGLTKIIYCFNRYAVNAALLYAAYSSYEIFTAACDLADTLILPVMSGFRPTVDDYVGVLGLITLQLLILSPCRSSWAFLAT